MRYLRSIIFLLLPVFLFSMQGCGGGSSGGAFTPVSSSNSSNNNNSNIPSSSVNATYSMTVSPSPAIVDANNGTVVATAKLVDSTGKVVTGVPVTFAVVAGPATVAPSLVTVNTDSNGQALTILQAGDTSVTTNVIFQARAAISGQSVTGLGNFQIARGTGIIKFVTDPTKSDETFLYTGNKSIDSNSSGALFLQQIPVKVMDANGNPRPGVPVTLSVYSHSSNITLQAPTSLVTIDYLTDPAGEPSPSTVTTDSRGEAIFNVTVLAFAPGIGGEVGDSIVFKAVTNDQNPLVGYVGMITNLVETAAKPTPASLSISPQTTSFSATDVVGAQKSFGISGGNGGLGGAGYTVSSSNPNLVTVSLSGTTAVATLADASLWTGAVFITVTDQNGATASATITRQ